MAHRQSWYPITSSDSLGRRSNLSIGYRLLLSKTMTHRQRKNVSRIFFEISLKCFYFHAATVGVSPKVSVSARGYVGEGLFLLPKSLREKKYNYDFLKKNVEKNF